MTLRKYPDNNDGLCPIRRRTNLSPKRRDNRRSFPGGCSLYGIVTTVPFLVLVLVLAVTTTAHKDHDHDHEHDHDHDHEHSGSGSVSTLSSKCPSTGTSSSNPLRRSHGVPVIIGHGGASSYLPEHTLEGYRLALELGADYIEVDVVPTSDHVLVCLGSGRGRGRDRNLNETTNVAEVFPDRTNLSPRDFTLEELQRLRVRVALPLVSTGRAGANFDGLFRIPTLREVLGLVGEFRQRTIPRKGGLYVGMDTVAGVDMVDLLWKELTRTASSSDDGTHGGHDHGGGHHGNHPHDHEHDHDHDHEHADDLEHDHDHDHDHDHEHVDDLEHDHDHDHDHDHEHVDDHEHDHEHADDLEHDHDHDHDHDHSSHHNDEDNEVIVPMDWIAAPNMNATATSSCDDMLPPLVIQSAHPELMTDLRSVMAAYASNTTTSTESTPLSIPAVLRVSSTECFREGFWFWLTRLSQTTVEGRIQGIALDTDCLRNGEDPHGFVMEAIHRGFAVHAWNLWTDTDVGTDHHHHPNDHDDDDTAVTVTDDLVHLLCRWQVDGVVTGRVDLAQRIVCDGRTDPLLSSSSSSSSSSFLSSATFATSAAALEEEEKIAADLCESDRGAQTMVRFVLSVGCILLGFCLGAFGPGLLTSASSPPNGTGTRSAWKAGRDHLRRKTGSPRQQAVPSSDFTIDDEDDDDDDSDDSKDNGNGII